MIKIDLLDIAGFLPAIHGMRNPKNSWKLSDSYFTDDGCSVGDRDMKLMSTLAKAGSEHRKFDRMINAYMDIEAGHTWWAEFDTYKVGTVRNSCSKMHKIHSIKFIRDQFDHEGIDEVGGRTVEVHKLVIAELEYLRNMFNATHEKKYWRAIIELLPMGFRLKATVMLNYETLYRIHEQRKNHKLDEWRVMCDFIETLPYFKEIFGIEVKE